MLICSISTHGSSSATRACLGRVAGGRRHPASAELSAIRHLAGNPPILWCGLHGTSPGETGRRGVKEHKSYFPVLRGEHAPSTERSQGWQGAGFDQMRANRLKSKRVVATRRGSRRRAIRRGTHLHQMRGSDSASCFAARIRVRTQRALRVSRASDLWNRFSLPWKQCSHCKLDLGYGRNV
jgi:hypothetical protein